MFYDEEICMLPENIKWKLALLISGLLAVTVGSVVALAIVLVNRDSPDSSPTPAETVAAQPTPEVTPSFVRVERDFLETVRKNSSFTLDSDEELVTVGKAICAAFDSGASFDAVSDTAVSSGMTDYNAGYIVGAAVNTLCPNHTDQLPTED